MNQLKRKNNEDVNDYIYRVCSHKQEFKLTWNKIAELINNELGCSYSESWYRKNFKEQKCRSLEISDETEQLFKLQKERIKAADERAQARAYLRTIAREETLFDIASMIMKNLEGVKLLNNTQPVASKQGCRKAILQLSDWHYGIELSNPWNTFNTKIAKDRISNLLTQVIHKCESNLVDEIYVVNLGDLISGRIHETIRIQNRIDVLTQIMEVTEILIELLTQLYAQGYQVNYISCNDNHSRLEPKKEFSLDLESLTRITDWVLKLVCDSSKVKILESPFGDDIATFNVYDYNVVAVHGHKDTPKNIVPNMSLMTHQYFDLALTAHLHHFSADEQNETVIVSNGSLMGVDDYAQTLRLTSKSSQNLIIVSSDSIVESIHRIVLN